MKNQNILTIIVLLSTLVWASCTEPIELELNTDNNIRLVVDAQLTTETKPHLVQLNQTSDYFKEGEAEAAENAVVTLSDGVTIETLNETTPGHY